MALTATATVEAAEAVLVCDTCKAKGCLSVETGEIEGRIRAFAREHRMPRVVGIRFTANGLDVGWWSP